MEPLFRYKFREENSDLIAELKSCKNGDCSDEYLAQLFKLKKETCHEDGNESDEIISSQDDSLFPENVEKAPPVFVKLMEDLDESRELDFMDMDENSFHQTEDGLDLNFQAHNCMPESVPEEIFAIGKALESFDLASLEEDLQFQIAKLKESLHGNEQQAQEKLLSDVSIFIKVQPVVVAAICEELEIENVSDSQFGILMQGILLLKTELSLINAVTFCRHSLYVRMEILKESTVSRLLSEAVLVFAQTFPLAAVEGLIVPLLRSNTMGTAQWEVIKLCVKDGLQGDSVEPCIRRCLEEYKSVNEDFVLVLHILVQKKSVIGHSLEVLVKYIHSSSEVLNSNIKFSKLILDVLNFFGNQMSKESLSLMQSVVNNNKSLFKKSLANTLKKYLN